MIGKFDSLAGKWAAGARPRLFLLLLFLLMVARGVVLLCVLPPLEGWDEYQHVGYIDYVSRKGELPVMGRPGVPQPDYLAVEYMQAMAALPQSTFSLRQLEGTPVRDYAAWWAGRPGPGGNEWQVSTVVLYEAQHPPGYYMAMAGVYRLLGGSEHLVRAIFGLRAVNLVLMALAVVGFGQALRELCKGSSDWAWGAAAVAVHPLFLSTGVRVANDALALAAAAVVTLLLVRLMAAVGGERKWSWGLVVGMGVMMGVAAWTKTTTLGMLPLVVGAVMVAGKTKDERQKTKSGKRVGAVAIIVGIFGMLFLPYVVWNMRLVGTPVPMVEAVENVRAGKTAWDLVAEAGRQDWAGLLRGWWTRQALWAGGWSYIQLPEWMTNVYEMLVAAGVAAAVIGVWFTKAAAVRRGMALGLAAWACCTLAMAVHSVQSGVARGTSGTNAWYGATVWPLFLLVVMMGYGMVRPWRWGRWVGMGLLVFYFLVEMYGTLGQMPRVYGVTGDWWLGIRRMAELRPAVLGTWTLWSALAGRGWEWWREARASVQCPVSSVQKRAKPE